MGRGTDTPFQVLGAPWIDGRALARHLNTRRLPGLRFVPVQFTPTSSRFAGERCDGIEILVVDRPRLRAVALGLELVRALAELHGDRFDAPACGKLLAHAETLRATLDRVEPAAVEAAWADDLDAYGRRVEPILLYPRKLR